jgi:hypothetical protein
MIKNFDEYINESRVIDSQNVKDSIHSLLLRPISFLDIEGKEMFRQIRKEFKSNNFEKALSLIAELKVYLLNNDRVERDHMYKKFMNKIDYILDEVDFDGVAVDDEAVDDEAVYDDFVYNSPLDDDEVPNRHHKINTKLDTRAVGRSKFDFIKGIAREYFEEIINKNGYISNLSKDELENVYKSEIKKIRRFLGENYYLDFDHFKALERILSSCINDGGYCYSLEEIKDICDAIKQNHRKYTDNDIERAVITMLKYLLDSNKSHKSTIIRKDKLNIVVDVCGKVLAGKVYYNAILDIYTKTEEEMEFLIDNFKNSSVYEVVTDYFDNIPDIDVYKIVDLS